MYFAKPPVRPDLDFYKEVFTILVKYNDRSVRLYLACHVPEHTYYITVEPFLKDTLK